MSWSFQTAVLENVFVAAAIVVITLILSCSSKAPEKTPQTGLGGSSAVNENSPWLGGDNESIWFADSPEPKTKSNLRRSTTKIVLEEGDGGRTKRDKHTRYFLRLKKSGHYYGLVRGGGQDSDSKLVKDGTYKILIHGFTCGMEETRTEMIDGNLMFQLADEYAKSGRDDLNVIIMDWTDLSTYSAQSYHKAAASTKSAGKDLADFLVKLRQRRMLDLDKVHLIGYSLGAHVAGWAGFEVEQKTGTKLKRITGLDPAGPLFVPVKRHLHDHDDASRALGESDAEFVDILHCDMGDIQFGQIGSKIQAGHADFYPNGGSNQPGCLLVPPPCSHRKCLEYFIASVNSKGKFPACKCSSYSAFNFAMCRCLQHSDDWAEMGEHLDITRAVGKYFLRIPIDFDVDDDEEDEVPHRQDDKFE